MKTTELTQAFERTLFARGGLSPAERDLLLSDFASTLGVYIPTAANASMDYYQPTESELTMPAQQKEFADMQRKQMEQDERLKAAELQAKNKAMVTEAALLKQQVVC